MAFCLDFHASLLETLIIRRRGRYAMNFHACLSFRLLLNSKATSAFTVLLAGLVLNRELSAHADQPLILSIAKTNAGQVVVTWTNAGVALEQSPLLPGSWNEITGAISPLFQAVTGRASFYRLR